MALGATMKLGYLECALLGRESPKPDELPRASTPGLGATLKFDNVDIQKDVSTAVQESIQPLEWTHPPVRDVQRDGNMCYQVSKAAMPTKRSHKHHLVQTTRLDPKPRSRTSSRPGSRPSSCSRAKEEIVVSAADFQRCGKSLTLLRQCQLEKLPRKSPEEEKAELALSFKSAFKNKCRSQDSPLRDPWTHMENPEIARPTYEGDLVLNEVWADSPSPASARSDASTRASSEDVVHASRVRGRSTDKTQSYPQYRSSRSSRRRANSCSNWTGEGLPTTPPLAFGGAQSNSRRTARHTSGLPRPPRETSLKAESKTYVSRIQLVGDTAEEEVTQYKGSLAVQQASRFQQRFMKEVDEDAEINRKQQALWLSVDPLTGDANVFPKAAATRLEAAFVNNRTRVPLAGLGGDFEDDIVHMPLKGNTEHPVQRSLQGASRDVRRLMVRTSAPEVYIHVLWDHGWHVADEEIPGITEARRIGLNGTETVRPPTPPLPSYNPDRRAYANNCCIIQRWE